mmetsp:Transcript_2047/g.5383  ORF Transcript_2047/g.5383 Transcript_2047/m.5383 type:complete len:219 (+) Transcript_2047:760-1416(+)
MSWDVLRCCAQNCCGNEIRPLFFPAVHSTTPPLHFDVLLRKRSAVRRTLSKSVSVVCDESMHVMNRVAPTTNSAFAACWPPVVSKLWSFKPQGLARRVGERLDDGMRYLVPCGQVLARHLQNFVPCLCADVGEGGMGRGEQLLVQVGHQHQQHVKERLVASCVELAICTDNGLHRMPRQQRECVGALLRAQLHDAGPCDVNALAQRAAAAVLAPVARL